MADERWNKFLNMRGLTGANPAGSFSARDAYSAYAKEVEDDEDKFQKFMQMRHPEQSFAGRQNILYNDITNQKKSPVVDAKSFMDQRAIMQNDFEKDARQRLVQSKIDDAEKANVFEYLEQKKDGRIAPKSIKEAQERLSELDEGVQELLGAYGSNYYNNADMKLSDTDRIRNNASARARGLSIGGEVEKNSYQKSMEGKINPRTRGLADNYVQNGEAQKAASEIMDATGWDFDTVNKYLTDAKAIGQFNKSLEEDTYTGLTPEEELFYAQYSIDHLSEGERNLFNKLIDAQGEYGKSNIKSMQPKGGLYSFDRASEEAKYANDASNLSYVSKMVNRDLKDRYGWDDEKIKNYSLMAKRLANKQATDALNWRYIIDENDSTLAKIGKSVVNTGHDLAEFIPSSVSSLFANTEARPEGFGVDKYSPFRYGTNSSDFATEQVVKNAITDDHPIGQAAYQIGLSTAESLEGIGMTAALSAIGAPAALADAASLGVFSASAYNQTYFAARDRGATDKEAQSLAIVSGLIEAGTEKFSLDHFWDMAKGTKAGKNILLNWLAQAGIEGSEEAAGDIANRIADYMILGKDGKNEQSIAIENIMEDTHCTREEATKMAEKDFWIQVAKDLGAGFISGGFIGGIGAYSGAQNAKYNQERANKISDKYSAVTSDGTNYGNAQKSQAETYANNPTQYMADMIDDSTAEGKKAKANVQQYADKEASGKKLSRSDRNDIEQSLWVADNAAMNSESSMDARAKYNRYVREMENVPNEYRTANSNITEDIAVERLAKAAKEGNAIAMGEVYHEMKNANSAELRSRADQIYSQYYGMAESHGATAQQLDAFKISEQDAYAAGLRGVTRGDMGALSHKAAGAFVAGQEARAKAQAQANVLNSDVQSAKLNTKNGKSVVLTGTFAEDGKVLTQDGESVSVSDLLMENRALHKAYAYADTMPSVSAKNAYISGLSNGMNIESYNVAWNSYFRAGRAGVTFDAQLKSAKYYADTLGEKTVRAMYDAGVAQAQLEARKTLAEGVNKAFKLKKGTGAFEDARTDKDSDVVKTKALKAIASVSGLNVRLVNSNKMKAGENAYFNPKTSTIVVGDGSLAQVFHEVIGEFTKFYNSEGYSAMKTAAMSVSKETLGDSEFNRIMDRYSDTYAKHGMKNTVEEMSDEMTNDFAVAVLSTEEGIEAFTKYLTEHYSEKQATTVKDHIVNLYHKIMDSIKSLIARSDMNFYQKKMLESKSADVGQYADMFIQAFDKAMQNYQTTEDGAELNGEIAFSMFVDADGIENYVMDDDVKKLSYGERKKKLLEIMNEQYKGRTAKFNKDSKVYYAFYNNESLRKGVFGDKKSDNRGYKTKINIGASGDYIELAENALYKGSSEEQGKKNKFHSDAKMWDYYQKTIKSGDRYYNVLVNVKDAGNDQYVYDITLKEAVSLPDAQGSYDGSSPASNVNISPSGSIVNEEKKYSLNIDSEGNELSEQQKEYFADSKVRDENGNLKVMHHGSNAYGFTVFDIKKAKASGLYGRGFYFTDSDTHAGQYGKTYNVYLNIENPLTLDTKDISKNQLEMFVNEIANDEDYGIDDYGYGSTVKSVVDGVWGKNDFDILQDINATCVGDFVETIKIFNKVNGTSYDGIVVPTETVAFYPNQIKNIDNLNPTDDEDIRYSLTIEDDNFFDMFGESNSTYTESSSILEEGMEALKHKKVDNETVRKIANKLKKEYGSTIDADTLSDNLQKVFAYMQTGDHVNYDDMMRVMQEVAMPVVDAVTEVTGVEEYNNFVDSLKGKKIKLTDVQKKEVISTFGSYAEFKRAVMPLTFSENGETNLEADWQELVVASGYALDENANEGDMPGMLYDTLTALRPSPVNNYGADREGVSRDLAMRIVEEYLNAQGDAKSKSIADKMRKQSAQYRAELRSKYENKLKETKADLRAKYGNQVSDIRNRNAERIAEIRAKNRESAKNARLNRLADHEKQMISKRAKDLMRWVSEPTEKHHVPREMVEPVTEFLYAMDFVKPDVKQNKEGQYYVRVYNHSVVGANGGRSHVFDTITGATKEEVLQKFYDAINGGLGSRAQRTWSDKMQLMKDLLDKVNKSEQFEQQSMSDFLQKIDPTLAEEFGDMLEANRGVANINELGYEELNIINKIVRGITHAINQGNKAFTQNANIADLAQKTIDLSKTGKRKSTTIKAINAEKNLLTLEMEKPSTYFALNGADEIYESLAEGQNTWIEDIRKAGEYMKEVMKDVKDTSDWFGKEYKEFQVYGGTVRLTIVQIMSLREMIKRDQTIIHLTGGMKAEKFMNGVKEMTQDVPVHFTMADIDNIIGSLTEEQIKVADAMQKYMATNCASQGNESTMIMYGYEKFTEGDHYFPIESDKDMVATKDNSEKVALNATERKGFTKKLVKNAKNPIVIRDIFDVFTEHVTDMALYHGYAPAIKDANRWYNFRSSEETGDFEKWTSTKQALNLINGDGGSKYYEKLIMDMNGGEVSQDVKTVMDKLISSYKAQAVGANLRVVIQQPTAYLRAMNVISPKYLLRANVFNSKESAKKMREQSPIAWWKSQGYFETGIGKSMKEMITGQSNVLEKAKNASMAPAGLADDLTWGVLYHAVTLEQKDLAKGENISQEELDARINKRFRYVIDKTQVVDSTLHRSQIMRRNGNFTKSYTAFMAEPTTSYNMLLEATIKDKREGSLNNVKRAVAAFTITNVINSVAQSVADAFRYDTDDDKWFDVFLDSLKENFIDNMNPFNLVPVLKDFVAGLSSFLSGGTYKSGSDKMEMQLMNSVYDLMNGINKGNRTPYGNALAGAKVLSSLTGVPLYNLTREIGTVHNALFEDWKKKVETTKYASVYDAIKRGRGVEEAVKKAVANGGIIKDIRSGITSRYHSDYYELLQTDPDQAAELAKKAKMGYMATGMSEAEADATIKEWETEVYSYSELDKAIESGEGITEAMQKAVDNKKADNISKHTVDRYESTIEYQNQNDMDNGLEGNIDSALGEIGHSYQSAKGVLDQKAAEKAEKAEQDEKKAGYKKKIFDSIDSGAYDYKESVKNLKDMGVSSSAIKSDITSQYKEKLVKLRNSGGDVTKAMDRIAKVRAYVDELYDGKKSFEEYYKDEYKKVKEWFK